MCDKTVDVEVPAETEVQKENKSEDHMADAQTPSSWKEQKALLWQASPLVVLFVINIFIQNILSISIFIALLSCFDAINDFIVRCSEQAVQTSLWKIVITTVYLVGCTVLAYSAVKAYWIFSIDALALWFGTATSFWSTLYLVTMVDFVLKFVTMTTKCLILLLSGIIIPVRKRGEIFMAIEGVSQIVRCVLPMPQWIRCILQSDVFLITILCWSLLVIYLILKVKNIKKKFALLTYPCRHQTIAGQSMVMIDFSEISENERFCPICHKQQSKPMRLACGHIYCRDCISLWFDREQHCPSCSSNAINSLVLGLQSVLTPLVQYTTSNCKWKTGTTDYVIQFF